MDLGTMQAQLRQIFEENVPFNRVLGLKVELIDPEAPKLRFDMRPELIGNPRRQILHGGVISAVLDVAAGFAVHLRSARTGSRIRTIAPPSRPSARSICAWTTCAPGAASYFIATGRVVRLGNRVAVAHTELENDAGELIATGGAAYMVG